jgi:hypothetical protein
MSKKTAEERILEAGDDIEYIAGGPNRDCKYYGAIHLNINNLLGEMYISTKPIFDSPQEAIKAAKNIVKKVINFKF